MSNHIATEYNVDNVYKTFSNVIDKSDMKSLHLHQFIIAFQELFFNHLNVVFSFVAHDLADKYYIIQNLCKTNPIDYRTVQTMIEYEKCRDDKTGTIALLRLLRALEFIYLFLEQAVMSPNCSSTTKQVAWDIYKQTLHKRHNKAVRLTIWFATATVPKREVLKETLLHGEIEPNTADKCFPLIENIYRSIYKLYEENNILELVPL
ncbi:unnamed protein product [Rotaria sp. Silwood2]|nr:unnamed protein product [Rotaria sp. Silwood2]CAF2686306.1 unnamed protein product [Rotaria sp. Silwood2]CAF2949763.1 unnamed protein product [Rotaria sp. Silwood2]CAF3094365.1 unnamed protein product [Rotaria sp. Silwood2]CAF3971394.1 unnamed protein product [Rotaria sp. Silwood2]